MHVTVDSDKVSASLLRLEEAHCAKRNNRLISFNYFVFYPVQNNFNIIILPLFFLCLDFVFDFLISKLSYGDLLCLFLLVFFFQGNLVPSDEITVYYRCQPAGDYLESVIQAHTGFILATTKAPLMPYPVPTGANVIVEEKTQVRRGLCLSTMPSSSQGVLQTHLTETPSSFCTLGTCV